MDVVTLAVDGEARVVLRIQILVTVAFGLQIFHDFEVWRGHARVRMDDVLGQRVLLLRHGLLRGCVSQRGLVVDEVRLVQQASCQTCLVNRLLEAVRLQEIAVGVDSLEGSARLAQTVSRRDNVRGHVGMLRRRGTQIVVFFLRLRLSIHIRVTYSLDSLL